MMKIIRITRHPADADRLEFLRRVFGSDVVVEDHDIPYGPDPVQAVQGLVSAVEGEVVAVEAIAPFPVLQKLVDAQRGRRLAFGCPLIRARFRRGEDGRAIVTGQDETGRDILAFEAYEELVRIEFEVKNLAPLVKRSRMVRRIISDWWGLWYQDHESAVPKAHLEAVRAFDRWMNATGEGLILPSLREQFPEQARWGLRSLVRECLNSRSEETSKAESLREQLMDTPEFINAVPEDIVLPD